MPRAVSCFGSHGASRCRWEGREDGAVMGTVGDSDARVGCMAPLGHWGESAGPAWGAGGGGAGGVRDGARRQRRRGGEDEDEEREEKEDVVGEELECTDQTSGGVVPTAGPVWVAGAVSASPRWPPAYRISRIRAMQGRSCSAVACPPARHPLTQERVRQGEGPQDPGRQHTYPKRAVFGASFSNPTKMSIPEGA